MRKPSTGGSGESIGAMARASIVDSSHLDHKSKSNWVVPGPLARDQRVRPLISSERRTIILRVLLSTSPSPPLSLSLSLSLFSSVPCPPYLPFRSSGESETKYISRSATSTDARQDKWPRDGGYITFQNWPNRRLSGR